MRIIALLEQDIQKQKINSCQTLRKKNVVVICSRVLLDFLPCILNSVYKKEFPRHMGKRKLQGLIFNLNFG